MTTRPLRVLFGMLLGVTLLAGCSRARMPGMSGAVIEPGRGVGPVALGMPLGDFLQRYGAGRPSVTASDESLAAELHFDSPPLAVRFEMGGSCRAALAASGSAVGALMSVARSGAFLQRYPDCAAMPLASIAVGAARWGKGPATARGLRVGSARDELAHALDVSVGQAPASPAGEGPDDGQYAVQVYDGLMVYLGARAAGTPNGALAPDAVVRRMVVVPALAALESQSQAQPSP